MGLVDRVYDLAESFPAREGYGLTSQITRAIVSVPANIAEGQARSTAKDFANFLAIARGQQDADFAQAPDCSEGAESVTPLSTVHYQLFTRGEVSWWRR